MSGYPRAHYGIDLTMLEWMRVGVPVILLPFGGGLSLAAALTASGADAPIAQWVSGLGSVPVRAMLRAGFGLNLIAVAVVVGFVWFVAF